MIEKWDQAESRHCNAALQYRRLCRMLGALIFQREGA
jgi:hypothetical protein